eukprot:COSAG06_NODE_30534_length_537_cov_0.940639_1_plen_111_part_10
MKMVREQMHTYTTLSDLWLHGVGSFHGPTMFICRNLGDSTSLPYLMMVEGGVALIVFRVQRGRDEHPMAWLAISSGGTGGIWVSQRKGRFSCASIAFCMKTKKEEHQRRGK